MSGDGGGDMQPCGEVGATIGLPPDAVTIRCELPAGHYSRHAGRSGCWPGSWGASHKPEPYGTYSWGIR